MRTLLKQSFPMGRFHANPWRVFAFDDPYGEWPPSPWRLLRAILARSFQLSRELYTDEQQYLTDERLREQLVHAFCSSKISWRLPACSWRGPGIQQYQPSEFKKIPADAKKPGEKTYNTSKVKDNFWVTPEEGEPLYWLFESTDNSLWGTDVLPHLDECLARMTYFGRAESITCIERVKNDSTTTIPNCELRASRTSTAVPVLCPTDDATFAQVACATDEKAIANSTTPPGAVWKYAERPAVAKITRPRKGAREFSPVSIVQFAVGGRVFPPASKWVKVVERFRGRVLRIAAQQLTGDMKATYRDLPPDYRDRLSLLCGKDGQGRPLRKHEHAYFCFWPDNYGLPTRLVCWRSTPFTADEMEALLAASEHPYSWEYGTPDWVVRMVPLPFETPSPPGFFDKSDTWVSVTPFVPPGNRRRFRSNGRERPGERPERLVGKLLCKCGYPAPDRVEILDGSQRSEWVLIHSTRKERIARLREASTSTMPGYRLKISFASAVKGPLALGHSAHFGLGLFAPQE
jgi:CRISPR-associated protein Csb2